ncbi:helix-turn-helix domain-containing protein [Allosphingosinicella sp.]|uniref:helix-turn-helix domain-containing protein n=1 Tax=Allosphingosinicella sp. TaxID=2823234 RepID=UPI003D758B4B
MGAWAHSSGLRPETLSRGFRLAYGCTPASFRSAARARAAWREVRNTDRPLVDIAADRGFSDQAHMTRAIRHLTGRPAGAWRERRGPTARTSIHHCTNRQGRRVQAQGFTLRNAW